MILKKVAGETPGGISIFSIPAGTLLGKWGGGAYNLYPLAWSPNDEFLALQGYPRHQRGEGLFVIRVAP